MTEAEEKRLNLIVKRINNSRRGNPVMNLDAMNSVQDDIISTGLPGLDDVLGVGGILRGSIIEIFGDEGTGKTALALYLAKQYQKAGKAVLYIDSERTLTKETIESAGVEKENFYILKENALEKVLNICTDGAAVFGAIIIDSFAGLTTKHQYSEDIDGENRSYYVARTVSSALPILSAYMADHGCTLIITNQLREKVGVMFGRPEYSTGGKALKYYFSVRLDLRKLEYLKNKGDIIGIRSRVKVVKNKIAAPYGETSIDIIFGQGVKAS